ncbi:MAG: glycosyl transferase family 1 [Phycisphaeraceae bacterium]|nr:glycosyl transferase family 1 [Phycisphaeraceae bacterium]
MTDLMPADAESGPRRRRMLLLLTSTAGGVGLHALYLARDLSRERFDLTVAFGPGYPLDDAFDRLGVPVERLSISRRLNPWVNLRGFVQVIRLMRRHRYDIVCMQQSIASFMGRVAAGLAGVPVRIVIVQVYASHPHQHPIKRGIFRLVERALDALTTRYVAVAESTRRFGVHSRIMKPDKVLVIHNATDLGVTPGGDRDDQRRALGVDGVAPVIVTVGRFERQKGLSDLLEGAAEVRRRGVTARFLIVGDGPLRADLERRARDLELSESVRFTGWRDDVPRVLAASDVFCLSSLWEQFPFVILEAMAMSLPVVATSVDGNPEAVVDGETGLLVPPRDPRSLADALVVLARDLPRAARMGRAGRRRVEERFGVERMIRSYEDMFQAACHDG